jgi:hypothetical protein
VRTNRLAIVVILLGGLGFARADLINRFTGFDYVWDVGTSGLMSSYDVDTRAGLSVSGPTTGSVLPTLGPSRVTFPNGIGQVPSPGGALGRNFDAGALGIKLDGNNLIVRLASGINPLTGYYYNGWQTWYGLGDMFVDVQDSGGVSHYALLESWARDANGNPIGLNRGRFNTAMTYHVNGGQGGSSLEGHLVKLRTNGDVALTGGTGAYTSSNAPAGLDLRAFAQGGDDRGSANLVHESLTDLGQNWYVETWTLGLSSLSSDSSFGLALRSGPSCGNDQIVGAFTVVPEPSALILALLGTVFARRLRPLA